MNNDRATRQVARAPNALIAQALASIAIVEAARNAVDIHWALSCPRPNAPMMEGKATLIVVAASMVDSEPQSRLNKSSQR